MNCSHILLSYCIKEAEPRPYAERGSWLVRCHPLQKLQGYSRISSVCRVELSLNLASARAKSAAIRSWYRTFLVVLHRRLRATLLPPS